MKGQRWCVVALAAAALCRVSPAAAQALADTGADAQQPMQMSMGAGNGWQFMQDGSLYLLFNHQRGPRGGTEVRAPNWWMGMATRSSGRQQLTFTAMFSLDPATVGEAGYRELFQAGEALHGAPLIDRQHPHDLFMQLAGVWRLALTERTGVTVAAGPVGEPALGPVAFMHRPSAADLPMAPLSHHTFDSTHVSFGVVTVAVDHGPWTIEGSVFNGREPDEHRWDFDFGALDSVSARLWYRPNAEWEFQVSTGHLHNPEELEPGNVERTTASASWFRNREGQFTAVAAGYGVNQTPDATRQAVFGEVTRNAGRNGVFGRVEVIQVETNALLTDRVPETSIEAAAHNALTAVTLGATRSLGTAHRLETAVGVEATWYAVPAPLRAAYGSHPAAVQVYVRIRPSTGSQGHMWNMRMSQPMAGLGMPAMAHGGTRLP